IAFDKAPVAIPATIFSSNPDSVASPFSQIASFAAFISVIYPASAGDKATIASQLPAHPCIINSYFVIDLSTTVIDLPMV
nr:hypothetical protein [Tanacetum cinerariifolium]